MVKNLSSASKKVIAAAISEAERTTSAEIVAVVAPASDAYQSYILLYGLMTGSAVDIVLWSAKAVSLFPVLLAIQLGVMALFSFIPWLRHVCLRLVPRRIRHHRAAHRAYEEYLIVSRHVSAQTPIALFYVSLAERYAHILTSRLVREKIPETNWNAVIDGFTASMKTQNTEQACIHAIKHMTALLEPHFPPQG